MRSISARSFSRRSFASDLLGCLLIEQVLQRWNVFFDCFPEDIHPNSKVLVDNNVPHTLDLVPIDVRKAIADLVGKLRDRLAYNANVSDNGINHYGVLLECLPVDTRDIQKNFFTRFSNIIEI